MDWNSPNIEIKAVSEIAIHFYGMRSIHLQNIVLGKFLTKLILINQFDF